MNFPWTWIHWPITSLTIWIRNFSLGSPCIYINWLQAVYDAFFISTYNVFYTSMPVIVMGIFDQDVDDTASLRYGSLFSSGMNNELFNRKLFAMEAIKGLLSSLILSGFAAGNLKFITLLLTVWKFRNFSATQIFTWNQI